MAELRLSQLALADIESIHGYLERERPTALRTVMRALLRALNQMELFPESGPVALTTRDGRIYRVIVAGTHLVYYRLIGDDVVFVARVWGAQRRPLRSAADLEPSG